MYWQVSGVQKDKELEPKEEQLKAIERAKPKPPPKPEPAHIRIIPEGSSEPLSQEELKGKLNTDPYPQEKDSPHSTSDQ